MCALTSCRRTGPLPRGLGRVRSQATPLALVLLLALLIAGCGGSTASQTPAGPTASQTSAAHAAVPNFGPCSTAVAAAHPLPALPTSMVALSGNPFGIASARNGRWSFVALLPGGRVAVLADSGFKPRLVRTIALPHPAYGDALTDNGRYLLVADGGYGATVLSVARAESGAPGAVLGTLERPPGHGASALAGPDAGAIEVTSSRDGRYAFVSVEHGNVIAVYDLHAALADHFASRSYLGSIPLGMAVVGMAVSPDGRWLYATSETAAPSLHLRGQGTLSVINLAKAEQNPARSVVANVPAHCSPVRVVVSADGATVWVTARESDQLLAFSASRLRTAPAAALAAAVRVGQEPVGLALVDGGRDVVIADSNRSNVAGGDSALTVVDARAALAHHPAVLGTIAAGLFPREMSLEPNGHTLLVGNFASGQLEAVGVSALP